LPVLDGSNLTGINSLPTGGTTGQVLTKIDDTDGNVEWSTPSSGSGSSKNTAYYTA
jgi:hypothetical protein